MIMGLDITLYSAAERTQDDRHWAEWNALYDRKESGVIDDAEFDELVKAITPHRGSSDKPSERYPEHLFDRRYLRSSYNDAGFNRAVLDFLGEDRGLYWIFEPMGREWDGDDGLLTSDDIPLLEQSRARALSVAELLRDSDGLRATATRAPIIGTLDHLWSALPSEDEVLRWFREERPETSFRSYSTAKGEIYKDGLTVLAITLGRDILGLPAPVVVYRSEAIDSYVQSAEITAEFCDEAIDLIKQDGTAYISWSG